MALTFDGNKWSDGQMLSWDVREEPEIIITSTENENPSSHFFNTKPIPMSHKNAIYSHDDDVILDLAAGPITRRLTLRHPVTCGTVIDNMKHFYHTKITLRHRKQHDLSQFPEAKFYADLLGDNVFMEGFNLNFEKGIMHHTPGFGS